MNWRSVERLFAVAMETPAEGREALLDSDPDHAVRTEVRRLLARHDALSYQYDPFLANLDLARAATLLESLEPDDPPAIDRYEIVRRLGSGATGVVYLAHDPSLARQVALKLLSPHLSNDATAIRRFTDEARAASRLDHPHIVAVYEIGRTADDRLFIAMAYYEGQTLRDRIAQGPLPVAEAMRIAGDVADALSAAHAQGIVHRDIKPENILLTARGACIVDFGIAKVVGETLTRTGSTLGTAAYMSPEQTRGTGVDHRSDLWSLGVVIYEMLTGQRPFRADGGEALIYGIRHDTAEPVSALRPGLAPAAARLVNRCLEKQPERRYQSASAVLSALRAPWGSSAGTGITRSLRRAGLAAGGVVVAAAIALPIGRRPTSGEPLTQLSTLVPLPQHPGAIAIFSPTEDRSDESLEDRQYLDAPNVGVFRDELIRGLSSTPGIRVASRSSVAILTGAGADVRTMGQRLGVTAVLEWNLRRRDSLISVDVRLDRAADGQNLWSNAYARPIGEVGAILEEIRQSVVVALDLRYANSAPLPRGATADLVAYDFYLRGRHAGSQNVAVGLFNEAISRDSGFALAYARLAEFYMRSWTGTPADRWDRVKPLISKALELDSTLALAHRLAGRIAMWQDRDWAAAEQHLTTALALDSSDTWAYHQYATYLAATGRMEEALATMRQATAVDPVSSVTATEVGLHLYWNRHAAEAIAVLERARLVDTVWWQKMPIVLGRAYIAVGRYDDAIREFRRAGVQSSDGFEAPALLGYALGIAGRTHEATALATQYEERARASSARPVDLVAVHLGLRDTSRALDWLEQIPGDRGSRFYLLSEPIFDPIRRSARFQRVLQELGLTTETKRPPTPRAVPLISSRKPIDPLLEPRQ